MSLKSYEDMEYHPMSEKIVRILQEKTQNPSPAFFRILVAYNFAKLASMMRVDISTLDRGDIPVNLYAINLSPSGTGKGYSTNIMEKEILPDFFNEFKQTFELSAERQLARIAIKRANVKGTSQEEEQTKVQKEFDALGPYAHTFDSGTSPAVKQMRHKLILAGAGSVNLQIDEIGSNFINSIEVLNTFLELFDVGDVKDKLTKHTKENLRNEEVKGLTPTNTMWFGTPSKLLCGGKTEEEFYSMLETGYARRCFFGFFKGEVKRMELTAEQVLDMLTNPAVTDTISDLRGHFENLASFNNLGMKLQVSRDTTLALIRYKMRCEEVAEKLPDHEEIRKAEICHRYFKALKLAGAYAFVDGSMELTEDHLYNAIKLTEDSGEALKELLTRDRNYVRLAKYIGSAGKRLSQAELVEDLAFYRGTYSAKLEMVTLATAWGYQNNILIKKTNESGIEFFEGEMLQETCTDKMIVSYSNDIASGYRSETAKFEDLGKLFSMNGMHWINHHLIDGDRGIGHRSDTNAIQGFNLLVIDVDGGISMEEAKSRLKGYKAYFYTTKRSTEEHNRFRVVFPTNYVLKLDRKEFAEFMKNFYTWLPFEVDGQTFDRARKWSSWNGDLHCQDGQLVDVLPFIPRTDKNAEYTKQHLSMESLSNLERWVLRNAPDSGRNNTLMRYGMMLADGGMDLAEIRGKVMELNSKLPEPLDMNELDKTIFVSVAKKINQRGNP